MYEKRHIDIPKEIQMTKVNKVKQHQRVIHNEEVAGK